MNVGVTVTLYNDANLPSSYHAHAWTYSRSLKEKKNGSEATHIILIHPEGDKEEEVVKNIPVYTIDWYVNWCRENKIKFADLTDENIPKVIKAYNRRDLPEQNYPDLKHPKYGGNAFEGGGKGHRGLACLVISALC